jgi:hypothetical protein
MSLNFVSSLQTVEPGCYRNSVQSSGMNCRWYGSIDDRDILGVKVTRETVFAKLHVQIGFRVPQVFHPTETVLFPPGGITVVN